tara:strand:+ start:1104122 stop:1105156 length:1035 start_codon:yes stop_codon:yes gene_type:complete
MATETTLATVQDVRAAEPRIREYLSPAPLIRSYALEQELGLAPGRCVWLKDYGWTPTGSFKVMGALNWVHQNRDRIGDRAVTAHSSGNFASGLSFACKQFGKRAIIVMPDNAPQVKFNLTRFFGAEIETYDIANDHVTGERNRLAEKIAQEADAVMASPYDDNHVIAGNGVGGLEITGALDSLGRRLSHFVCGVSGGGLMSGHLLSIADSFPEAKMIAVEPDGADDFAQSLASGQRVSIELPTSICDGLLSYDVGEHNWPILRRYVTQSLTIADAKTIDAMRWVYCHHGLRIEPSGAITIASLLSGKIDLRGDGDIVAVISGRNIDDQQFVKYLSDTSDDSSPA